jgi:S1-C subfamily serine protease
LDFSDFFLAVREKLLSSEGVVGVSTGSRKLIVYTEKPISFSSSVAGFPVEVRVIGRLFAISAQTIPMTSSERRDRGAPLVGGMSIGGCRVVSTGTLGFVVVAGGDPYIITNAHVVENSSPGDPVIRPGMVDGGVCSQDVVARITKVVDIDFSGRYNSIDLAVAHVNKDVDYRDMEVIGIGRVSGFTRAFTGMVVRKSGRTTGVTENMVIDTGATIKVCYDLECKKVAVFENQILIRQPFADLGDSGSIVIDRYGRAVGLLFASGEKVSAANHIADVLRVSGLDIAAPIEIAPRGIFIAPVAGAVMLGLGILIQRQSLRGRP